eukprot:CAMPEP_0167750178 /NCGR_PEP_ID=MMETSP0110_2-20121227/5843_1 /TAXON_ID=629695 /ORGANISM="Gymnochlora sp., Strain CCMP2014" /LENGTH=546 /DNA_ID=CAMNT_0007635463 /DNA_START=186 /DNA_END=1826 /DNA_ORIENTATION=+
MPFFITHGNVASKVAKGPRGMVGRFRTARRERMGCQAEIGTKGEMFQRVKSPPPAKPSATMNPGLDSTLPFKLTESFMPPTPAADPSSPKLLAIFPKDDQSPIKFPRSLDFGRPNATWGEVMEQMKRRLAWTEDGFDLTILDANDLTAEELLSHAINTDIFFFIGLGANKTAAELIGTNTQIIPSGVCLGCSSDLEELSRFDFQPASSFRIGRQLNVPFLPPWSFASQLGRLFKTVDELFSRGNHLDLYYAFLTLIDKVKPVGLVGANSKLDLRGLYCLLKKCRKPLRSCLSSPECKKCVDELDKVGLRDQVKAYSIIRSYESREFERLSLCINEKNNCLRNNAQRPLLPNVTPMKTFRGEPLTWEAAETILIGRRNENNPLSWMLVCGQNPAYDEFPCQYQMFYRGKAKKSLWYNPVFKLFTPDGKEVWRKSDYKVRRDEVPGKFKFSFCDNGVTSQENWHIIDASDDLSWAVLYYSGAAATAGQAYVGAMLATHDGKWPDPSELPRITKALESAGIPWHEMVEVCNDNCSNAPLVALHPDRDLP